MSGGWSILVVHHNQEETVPGSLEPLYMDSDLHPFETRRDVMREYVPIMKRYRAQSYYFQEDESGSVAFYWHEKEQDMQVLTYVSLQLEGETVHPALFSV